MRSPEWAANMRRCWWWAVLIAVPVAAVTLLTSALMPQGAALFKEGGLVEMTSATVWGIAVLGGVWGALRAGTCTQRLLLAWFAGLALLAGLREFDLHTALNPDTLGEFGVRYKLSWWVSGSVPLWLKLGWGLLFFLVCIGLIYPPLRTRRELLGFLRRGDPRLLLFGAALIFLALGFAVDDLMRGSKWVRFETRQLIEETTELIGACVYCFAVWQLVRRPLSQALPSAVTEAESPPASP